MPPTSMRHRSRRALRPWAETFEPRALPSGFTPTAVEQYYLELLNDARFNPAAYGVSNGLDLSTVAPAQPLAMNMSLVEAARLHSQDMLAQGYFAHVTPGGVDPGGRIAATGFVANGWAESIETNTRSSSYGGGFPADYATWDAGYSLSNLIVDQGVPDLGHRIMLLDIGGGDQAMKQVGIGIASQDTTSGVFSLRQTDTTIDLAATTDTRAFLTGVVFTDTTGSGTYQPGEGLGGVTISVAGAGTTTTMAAGGYAIPLSPGTYTVTASGGGLAGPIARTIVIGTQNVRLDLVTNPNGATLDAAQSGTVSGQLGTFSAIAAGDTVASYGARIDWGNGNATAASLIANPNGTFSVQGSESYVGTGVYPVRVLVTHLSDGQTVAINATVVVSSSTDTGPPFPSPAYPGGGSLGPGSTAPTGNGGSGAGSTAPAGTGGSGMIATGHHRRHQKHPKVRHPAGHATHPIRHRPAHVRAHQAVAPHRRLHH